MATTWKAPTWRMPNDKNQSKFESYSLDFGSATQYISTPSTWQSDVGLDNVKKLSFSVWVNPNSGTGSNIMAVTSQAYGAWNGNFNITYRADITTLALEFRSAGGIFTNNSTTLAGDTWHHICFVLDLTLGGTIAQEVRCFVNNSEVVNQSSQNPPLNFILKTTPFNFGRTLWGESTPNGSGYQWQGKIAQACFFDYALSESQISSLYNSGSPINPMTLKPAPIASYLLGGDASTGGDSSNTLSVPNVAVPDASVFNFDNNPTILFDNNFFTPSGTVGGTGNFMQVSSISWWMKSSRSGSYSVIFPFDANNAWMLRIDNLGNMWWFAGAGTNYVKFNNVTANSINLCDSQWHHCVFTIPDANDKNQCKFFIDNQEITSTTTAGASTGYGALYIMTKLQLAGGYLGDIEGTEISNVQVWLNTALGNSDINTIYNNGVPLLTGTQPQEANLKAWYKLDQLDSYWDIAGTANWTISNEAIN